MYHIDFADIDINKSTKGCLPNSGFLRGSYSSALTPFFSIVFSSLLPPFSPVLFFLFSHLFPSSSYNTVSQRKERRFMGLFSGLLTWQSVLSVLHHATSNRVASQFQECLLLQHRLHQKSVLGERHTYLPYPHPLFSTTSHRGLY